MNLVVCLQAGIRKKTEAEIIKPLVNLLMLLILQILICMHNFQQQDMCTS